VNKSIAKLYVVVILLFALLLVFTSRWTVFDANALNANALNKLSFFATEKVKRGRLLADDGTTALAKSVASHGIYTRTYPEGSLFSQTVGYANIQQNQETGLEKEYLKQLENRQTTALSSVFGPISTSNLGNDVYTTLDAKAQAEARSLLAGRVGSVVAIVPQTGDVPVMYSNPTYDDNDPSAACPQDITDTELNPGLEDDCQLNLATQGAFAPGSTFKVVTTAAALNTGKYTPDSEIAGPSPLTVSGVPLENDGDTSYPDETLTYALTNSINTIYAQVGQNLGRATMEDYMKRFGFYRVPPIDLPAGEVDSSGERSANGKLLLPTSDQVDLGRMSIGQDKLAVTPLQMAMVASAVADGGKLMEPRLATKVVNPDGQQVQTIAPKLYDTVMTSKTASELSSMMTDVVEEGTGTAANLEGLTGQVAGKTGTATVGGTSADPIDDAWFIGFAPVKDPKIAVAVVLRNIPNGYGGTYAAPIAAQMMKTLLAEGL
jgi:peptidoglycan glycosyltransferase